LGLFDCWIIMLTSHTILNTVTMETNACNVLSGKNYIEAMMLP
jgi:hypothetical protein